METATRNSIQAFANGHFEKAYDYMADNIQWNIIGSTLSKGKNEVVAFCDKANIEMAGTIVTCTSCIEDGDTIAIQGYCHYTKPGNQKVKLEFCEIYTVKNEKIQDIKTYCAELLVL